MVFISLSKLGKIRNNVNAFVIAFISSIIISPLIYVIFLNIGVF